MATPFTCFSPSPILSSSAASNHRKPDPNSRKPPPSSSSNWWTPLFGWSSDPEYINNPNTTTTNNNNNNKRKKNNNEPVSDIYEPADSEAGRSRSRFNPGCFTEDKAKQLRKKTAETAAFHDIMYHSAIASRLASDISDRYDF
ncbi:hypothetical protein ACSBR2_042779 [Camellia fascicularis]